MPTQPLTLPNGKVVQVPAEWGPEDAQAWVNNQPHIKAQWQRDFDAGVDKIPDAMGLGSLAKSLIKGTVDTVAHPIENLPTLGAAAGSALAAPVAALTGGAAMPLAMGLPAAGAAVGHGVRDFIRHQENDPRASQSLGDEALSAAGSGLMEGALSAVPVGLSKLAGPLKRSAISTYTRALGVTPAMVRKLPVSMNPTGARMTLAEKALKLGEEGLNRDIKVNPEGFRDVQTAMDDMGAIKDYILSQSRARFTPARELLDPATNPMLGKAKQKFTRTLTPQGAQDAFGAMEDAVKTSPSLTRSGRPRTMNATQFHELASNSSSVLGDVFGDTKSVGKEASKALNTGAMSLLKQRVPDIAAPMEEQFILDKLRKAMENTMVHGEVAKDSIPGIYLAWAHPGLALASTVVRDPVTQARMMSASAFHRKAGSEAMEKLGRSIPKANILRQLGTEMSAPDSDSEERRIWDLLTRQWEQGK